ncbi:M56 family metallopeptidase [Sinomicrobium soli]|uniref:M56 family metallopeptidase n=1 Tax=Sinomicrobium sp. N-1-3-6 TaxID=2219864 RepID=UPI000DCEF56D|nr:M56 family metallopeptidase [Sinomicrobium sp. N-1-3-6]RAV29745.1 hypothetical protein DN748_06420 [Sinomicrobium sp. N-1-3-6]
MEDFLWYTVKSGSLVALFYLCYILLIHGQTFFRLNRFFLLTGLGCAVVVPLIFITRTVYTGHIWNAAEGMAAGTGLREVSAGPGMVSFLFWGYMAGMGFFLGRFLLQLLSVWAFLGKCRKTRRGGFVLAETEEDTAPFSFFGFMVYNPEMRDREEEWESVMSHELAHIRQKHSFDVLAANLFTVFQWWNPLVWRYRKIMVQNLEYLADDHAAENSGSEKDYQRLLLRYAEERCKDNVLINTFFNSSIKKRIVMLNKNKSGKRQLWRYTAVLPFVALFLLTVNTRTVAQETESDNPGNITEMVVTKNTTDHYLEQRIEEFKEREGVKVSFSGIKRNTDGEIVAIASAFDSGSGDSGSFNTQSDTPIKPFRFYVSRKNGGIDDIGYATREPTATTVTGNPWKVTGITTKDGKNPLLVIDGKVMGEDALPSPERIQSINVLKGSTATTVYGDRGKDGVIEVTTKKGE